MTRAAVPNPLFTTIPIAAINMAPIHEPSARLGNRAIRRIALTLLVAGFLVVGLLSTASAASAPFFVKTTLTESAADPAGARISDGRAVWTTFDGTDSEIVTWAATSGTVQLTTNTVDDGQVQVSGDRVVWRGGIDDAHTEIYTWTPATGTVRLTTNSYPDGSPQVSGDRVVWQGHDGTDYEIYTWTQADGVVPLTTNSVPDTIPQISGDRVVWESNADPDQEILTWTPSGGTLEVTAGTALGIRPQVSGDRVVYYGTEAYGYSWHVYTWTPDGGIVYVTSSYDYGSPTPYQLSGDRIVWSRGSEICSWTPDRPFEVVVTSPSDGHRYPRVSGDRVVWERMTPGDYYEVWTWTPEAGASRLSLMQYESRTPDVSGDQVVWQESDGTRVGVVLAFLDAQIAGSVQGDNNGTTVPLAGAIVTVSLDPTDVSFDDANPSNNLIGTATAGTDGDYLVDVSRFRGAELPLGSQVDVTASAPGYLPVQQDGSYSRSVVVCNFLAFDSQIGTPWEDRRLPKDDGQGAPVPYSHLLPDYLSGPPTIESISPESGPTGGGTVVLHGTGFVGLRGPGAVRLAGVDALGYTVDSDTQITAILPAHPFGLVDVEVRTLGGSAHYTADIQYLCVRPFVSSVTPWQGPSRGGNTVVITGTGFSPLSGPAAVRFGGTNAASYVVDSDTQITAIAPAHEPGEGSVQIFDAADQSFIHNGSRYVFIAAPVITYISPNSGLTSGGTTVSIFGTGFSSLSGPSAVRFGDTDAASYTVLSSTEIRAVTPPHAAGTVQVTVTALGGPSEDTAADDFFYRAPLPTVTSLSPPSGPAAGETSVVITGTNFTGLTGPGAVKFGDFDAASYTLDSPTRITAVSPPHVPGRVPVKVTTAAGSNPDGSTVNFTYLPAPSTPEVFSPTRLTTNSYDDEMPEVSGDRIVWAAIADDTDHEVFTWTPSTGVVRLTTNSRDDQYPVVSGNRIAWVQTGGSDGGADDEVFTWTPAGGVVQLTRNNLEDGWVNISGDRIVWMEAQTTTGANAEIFTWTPSGTQRITNNSYEDYYPEVSDNRIAWVNDSAPNGKALTWTPSAGTVEVYSGDRSIDYATVSGDRVACASMPDRIYVWTPSGGSWVDAGNIGFDLRIDGERIAWDAEVRGVNQVFSWTAGEGTTQLSNGAADQFLERVSGDRVVWLDYGTADSEVYCWTPDRGAVQVTSDTVEQWAPVVSGNRLVWMGANATGTMEIYTTVAGPPLTRVEESDPHILFFPSTSWLSFSSASASASAYKRANTGGSSATVYFDGTRLDWIAMKGTSTGKADVYLDDEFKTTIDLSAGVASYQVNVWSTGTIAAGLHKFSIVWNKDNLAGKYITLDRVEVAGTLLHGPPTITSLFPSSGSTLGGTPVTINGTGFADVASVTFDGSAVPYTVVSSTKINAVAPAHEAGTVRVQVTAAGGTTPDTLTDDFTYSVAPPTTRMDVKKTTTVTTPGSTWSGTWSSYTSTSSYSGGYMRSSTAGAYVVVSFKGTQLDWIAMKGTSTGIADVYVDGSAIKAATVDLRATSASYQQNVWSTGTLPDGYHTVKIVRSSASASGKYLTIDAVDIAGTLVPTTRIEENAGQAQSLFLWNPAFASWTTGTTTSASGGTYKYINSAGASATIEFTGPSIALIAKKAPSYGNLTVTLDGVSKTVSLYSSTTEYKKTVYASGFLTPGNHTLVITRTGTKSSSSSGYTIDIDAIDLIGELR